MEPGPPPAAGLSTSFRGGVYSSDPETLSGPVLRQSCIIVGIASEGEAAIYRSLVTLSVLMTLVTVVLSAYIRLAEVGIGCADWPQCYGQLDPAGEQRGVTVLTEAGRDMGNHGARVAHRYIASALGLFVLVIFIQSLRSGAGRRTALWIPSTVFAVTIFLSVLGYYTPTRSNPLITMGNLLGGMALLGLLWWLMQREAGIAGLRGLESAQRPLAVVALLLAMAQIILGGWSSANYASTSCQGLVTCHGDWWAAEHIANAFDPSRHIQIDASGRVVPEDALAWLSMTHRLFAIITAAYLAWLVRRLRPRGELRPTLAVLAACSMGQIIVGVAAVWLQLPLLLLTLHNLLAACLLLGSVNLLLWLSPAAASPPRL